jgi:hypothetical protein
MDQRLTQQPGVFELVTEALGELESEALRLLRRPRPAHARTADADRGAQCAALA